MPSEPNSHGFTALVSFPKSLDVKKAIGKLYSQKQRAHGRIPLEGTETMRLHEGLGTATKPSYEPICVARKPLSEAGVARNVLAHSYRIENGTRYVPGTGALNIDATRVQHSSDADRASATPQGRATAKSGALAGGVQNDNARSEFERPDTSKGRWSPNLLLSHSESCVPTGEVRRVKADGAYPAKRGVSHFGNGKGTNDGIRREVADPEGYEPQEVYDRDEGCPVRLMDEQSGVSKSQRTNRGNRDDIRGDNYGRSNGSRIEGSDSVRGHSDSGGSSRFFPRFHEPFKYAAKSSRRERNAGLEGMPEKQSSKMGAGIVSCVGHPNPNAKGNTSSEDRKASNFHPTVKPLALMRWLVRLVTPPGGTVLDCFAGSGSTGCAAVLEGFNFIGIEMDESYAEIAERRIAYWSLPETERSDSKKAPPPNRTTYGFKTTDVLRRCPEHGEPIPSGSTFYKCGCKKVWHKVEETPVQEANEALF